MWSYELLSPPEYVLPGQFAVCADGWMLAAAFRAGDGLPVEEVLDHLK